jgi:hypothetical protein
MLTREELYKFFETGLNQFGVFCKSSQIKIRKEKGKRKRKEKEKEKKATGNVLAQDQK